MIVVVDPHLVVIRPRSEGSSSPRWNCHRLGLKQCFANHTTSFKTAKKVVFQLVVYLHLFSSSIPLLYIKNVVIFCFFTQPALAPAPAPALPPPPRPSPISTFSLCRTPTIQINNVALLRKNTNEPRSEVVLRQASEEDLPTNHQETSSWSWSSIPPPLAPKARSETLSSIWNHFDPRPDLEEEQQRQEGEVKKRKSFFHFHFRLPFSVHHYPYLPLPLPLPLTLPSLSEENAGCLF